MIVGPPATCWLHPALEVRASSIAGVGLFSRTVIDEGEVVSRLGGRLVPTGELNELFARVNAAGEFVDTITAGIERHLVLPSGSPNGRGNHSCDPNTWWIDDYTLAARRAIGADEEVTNDYGTSSGLEEFVMPCNCGAPICRGQVTGRDWSRADLRARYGDHWVPVLLARIHDDDAAIGLDDPPHAHFE